MKGSLNLYQQISHNKRISTVIIVLFGLFGLLFAGAITVFLELPPTSIIFVALILGVLMMVLYSSASTGILSISGARPVKREEYPFVFHTVEGLAIAAGVPAPKCYVIDSAAPNAFATGRNPQEGVIALTTGLIEKLNNEEIEAVIAHEMAHIQNYDIRLATIAIAFVGTITIISEGMLRVLYYGSLTGGRRSSRRSSKGGGSGQVILILISLVFMILAPIFARLLHLIMSRRREFLADSSGAFLTRNPGGLARALRKISSDPVELETASKATAPLYFVNPLNKASGAQGWLATHPPIKERIEILERMSYERR